jgi:hypothetical protein
LNNNTFLRLVGTRIRLVVIRSSLGELMTAAVRADKIGYTPSLALRDANASPFNDLYHCDDVAIIVNRHLGAKASPAEKERLLDLLFSPEIADWDPFAHSLDFRRSREVDYLGLIRYQTKSTQPQYAYSALVIHGRAASGKTVILKRLAYELAKSGEFVVWLRPSSFGESLQTIKFLLESISNIKEFRSCPRAIVVSLNLSYPEVCVR